MELAQNAGYYHDAENGGAGRHHLIRVLVLRAKEFEGKGLDGTALLQRCLQARGPPPPRSPRAARAPGPPGLWLPPSSPPDLTA